jgi:hypothetical protein
MRSILNNFIAGVRIGLDSPKSWVGFIILWVLFFIIMFSIPVLNIPGNSILFQAELFHYGDYLLLIALSSLSALSLLLQWVAFRSTRKGAAQGAVLGGTGVLSGVISSLFASASCATCVGALFSFLGFNTVLFLAIHHWYIITIAFLLLFASIYLATRKIVMGCEVCLVDIKK